MLRACRFRETWDALPQPVMKADACRLLYMHHFGGAPRAAGAPVVFEAVGAALGRALRQQVRHALRLSSAAADSRPAA